MQLFYFANITFIVLLYTVQDKRERVQFKNNFLYYKE